MTRTVSPGPRTGAVQIPASKSQAHRMLICAALSKAPSRLVLDGFSADIEATVQCLEALGAQLTQETAGLLITPIGARPANAKLDVGESGSTLRFLLPVLGALGVRAEVRMHGRLPERPLSPLWEVLEAHGMRLRQDGIVLYTDGQLCAGDYSLPGDVSSQFLSGLLFALPLLGENSTLTFAGALQSARYVAMTEQALRAAGIHFEKTGQCWTIPGGQRYAAPGRQLVEGDWSNAAFFLCMGALSRQGICVSGLDPASLQADRAITEILTRFGAEVNIEDDTVTVRRGTLRGITLDAGPVPDLVPVVSVLAALCAGNILLTTGSHTLSVYAKVIEPERLFVRVLPTHQALDLCAAAGMVQSHVIAMQGPFSRDFNAALYDQLRIRTMVSKDSGQPGGVADKVLPALERGIDVVMIERPKEDKR